MLPFFTIQFDENYNITYKPKDFGVYLAAAKPLEESSIIAKEKAISVLEYSFSEKARNSKVPMLIYDASNNGRLYWRITRQRGFRSVTEEM